MRPRLHWIDYPPHRIAIAARPMGDDWLEDEVQSLRAAGVDVLVSLLTQDESAELGLLDEPIVSIASGLDFHSLAIEDRGLPSDIGAVRILVSRVAADLRRGRSVAIHCRAGIGRSGTIAACVLCSLGLQPEEAFRRITKTRGCSVPDTDEQREWVKAFARTGAGKT